MKIHILSDLHLEFANYQPQRTDADVVILAGDTHLGKRGITWAISNFPDTPVLYILGNHEYYGHILPKLVADLKDIAKGTNIRILENDIAVIEDVEFLGCTLWTDFKLFGRDPRVTGSAVEQAMSDYRKIRVSPNYSKLRFMNTAATHAKSVNWLIQQGTPSTKKRVIITHHAPSKKSVPEKFQNELVSAGYASNLDEIIMASGALVWIHGHIHHYQDYYIGATRVICNPRGYPDEMGVEFNQTLIVEV